MNIVIFNNRHTASKHFNISRFTLTLLVLLFIVTPMVVGGAGLYFILKQEDKLLTNESARQWMSDLTTQKEEVLKLKQHSQEQLDALTVRIAELQARLVRLDALGKRLTHIADLDQGEFDFDRTPPVGGPAAKETGVRVEVDDFISSLDELARTIEDRQQQLEVIESLLGNRKIQDDVFIAGRPIKKGWLSSKYGKRTDPFTGRKAWHEGVDFAGKDGSEIIAVAAGVITWSGPRYGYGLMVEVDHGGGYTTRYAHNKENAVKPGDIVSKGQVLAYMGSSGRSTGPHVHYEVRHKGRSVNPAKFINRASR
ncbi:M23 family metallopeptidase [Oceanospirillum sediminis]|uniref:M23 family metallopeptidase n=1 Tax=Oceanospirillum sediminis TaxID=2760088 RepID=A0A839IJF4_9GAMM|nr:M23 family metallopeptidase [Oceanospirillum sediminis]MBB1485473.1 M23 family metallopeptidase [Oceanospirillum sediminis]